MTQPTALPSGEDRHGRRYDDERARVALEMLLDLRRRAEACPQVAESDAHFAAMAAGFLVRGILGWAAEALGLLYDAREGQRPPVEQARLIIARTLELGLPVMQPSANTALTSALRALNGGQVDALVEKSERRRRGEATYDKAVAELSMLMWVRWQHGLGRPVKEAEEKLADAVGQDRSTLQKWRPELSKIFGEEQVARKLDYAKRLGRVEAAKEAGAPGAEALRFGDDPDGRCLLEAFLETPRSLEAAVALRRRGMQKRRVEKSSEK